MDTKHPVRHPPALEIEDLSPTRLPGLPLKHIRCRDRSPDAMIDIVLDDYIKVPGPLTGD